MEAGTRILRSCELAESIWMQVEDLSNALIAMTEAALENQAFANVQAAGPVRQSPQPSASGWTYMGNAITFPLMQKKRRKLVPTAWLSYQISVFGSGIPPMHDRGQESVGPVVHVSFWHAATDFDDTAMHVAFPPAWDDYELKHRRLLAWDSEETDQFPQWTFSLRLLSLHSEDALRLSIIGPVQALLAGTAVDLALPADLPGMIFYANDGQGANTGHLLACAAP